MIVDYVNGRGDPFPGLGRQERPLGIVVHQYDPEKVTCPTTDDTELGDLACRMGSEPTDGLMARLADGWHRVGSVTVETHSAEMEELQDWSSSVFRAPAWSNRMTVTLTDVDPEVVALLSGTVDDGVPRHWEDAHPRGRVSTPTAKEPFWECSACGAVTADEGLFREAACMTR